MNNSLCDKCKLVQNDFLERGFCTQVICEHYCRTNALIIDVVDEADLSAIFNAGDETTEKLVASLRGEPTPPPPTTTTTTTTTTSPPLM